MNYENLWRTSKKHAKRNRNDAKDVGGGVARANVHPVRVVKRPQRTADADHRGHCVDAGRVDRLSFGDKGKRLKRGQKIAFAKKELPSRD